MSHLARGNICNILFYWDHMQYKVSIFLSKPDVVGKNWNLRKKMNLRMKMTMNCSMMNLKK